MWPFHTRKQRYNTEALLAQETGLRPVDIDHLVYACGWTFSIGMENSCNAADVETYLVEGKSRYAAPG